MSLIEIIYYYQELYHKYSPGYAKAQIEAMCSPEIADAVIRTFNQDGVLVATDIQGERQRKLILRSTD